MVYAIKYLIKIWLIVSCLFFISGCYKNIRNNAPVCRISFDLKDDALLSLNLQNKRAIKSFIEVCRK